jgi:hypothetical protein
MKGLIGQVLIERPSNTIIGCGNNTFELGRHNHATEQE